MNKNQELTKYITQGGFGGTPTADSRFTVPSYRTGTLSEIRPDNMYLPLTTIVKKETSRQIR